MSAANPNPVKDAAEFEAHRRYLTGVAYRMLGTLADAEDVVQDAYVRWHAAAASASTGLENPRAYFARIVTRLCLDRMKSSQARREAYVGPWLPEPVVGGALNEGADTEAERANDISYALLLTLERLSPLERAAFLLHDVFEYEFDQIADILERSEDSCRQLASRARSHIRGDRPRFEASVEARRRLAEAFTAATRTGDPSALAAILAEDVVFLSDGGGRVPAAINPILGRDHVSKMIAGLGQRWRDLPQIRFAFAEINGLAGIIFYDGEKPFQTLALEASADGSIAAVYVVRNPDKLKHVPYFGETSALPLA
jgi:RNA polymerase sigma-70 factor, ECF subfamily